jgi:hypothetical protein
MKTKSDWEDELKAILEKIQSIPLRQVKAVDQILAIAQSKLKPKDREVIASALLDLLQAWADDVEGYDDEDLDEDDLDGDDELPPPSPEELDKWACNLKMAAGRAGYEGLDGSWINKTISTGGKVLGLLHNPSCLPSSNRVVIETAGGAIGEVSIANFQNLYVKSRAPLVKTHNGKVIEFPRRQEPAA